MAEHLSTDLNALLDRAEKALTASFTAALTVKPNLDTPYTDDPRWSPWTRWVDPAAREAHDVVMMLRRVIRERREF